MGGYGATKWTFQLWACKCWTPALKAEGCSFQGVVYTVQHRVLLYYFLLYYTIVCYTVLYTTIYYIPYYGTIGTSFGSRESDLEIVDWDLWRTKATMSTAQILLMMSILHHPIYTKLYYTTRIPGGMVYKANDHEPWRSSCRGGYQGPVSW